MYCHQKVEVDEVPDLKIASEVNIKPPIYVDETEENSHAKLDVSEVEVEKEPVKEGEKSETFSVQEKLGSEIKTEKYNSGYTTSNCVSRN